MVTGVIINPNSPANRKEKRTAFGSLFFLYEKINSYCGIEIMDMVRPSLAEAITFFGV